MTAESEFRRLRRREAALRDDLDRAPDPPRGGATVLAQVFNAGLMPSSVPGYFAFHPVTASGAEAEGGTGTLSPASGQGVVLVIGPKVPAVGDVLVARLVGGRWVAGVGAGCDPATTYLDVTVRDPCNSLAAVGGAAVSAVQGGTTVSGTTNGSGFVSLLLGATGAWSVTAAAAALPATTVPVTAACGRNTVVIYMGGCDDSGWPTPVTLTAGGQTVTLVPFAGNWTADFQWPDAHGQAARLDPGVNCNASPTFKVRFNFSCSGSGSTPGCPSASYQVWEDACFGGAFAGTFVGTGSMANLPGAPTATVNGTLVSYRESPLHAVFSFPATSPGMLNPPPFVGNATYTP
jgi:hypothetical protein